MRCSALLTQTLQFRVQFAPLRTVGPRRTLSFNHWCWFCGKALYLVNLQHRLLPEAGGHERLQVLLVERGLVLQIELHMLLDGLEAYTEL